MPAVPKAELWERGSAAQGGFLAGRQVSDPLQLGLGIGFYFLIFLIFNLIFIFYFFKGKNREPGVNHHLVTFLNCGFGSRDVSGL